MRGNSCWLLARRKSWAPCRTRLRTRRCAKRRTQSLGKVGGLMSGMVRPIKRRANFGTGALAGACGGAAEMVQLLDLR
eukprot:4716761-Pyramimonas_sp.AAC.1